LSQKRNGKSGTSPRKGPVTEREKKNLKRSAVEMVADNSHLISDEMEATILTVGDPKSMANIREIVASSIGEKGWCVQCDSLKIVMGSIKKELGLIRARDTIAEVVAVVYDNIEFVHEGHSIKKYGDVHDLRKTLRKSGQDMSGLNRAVVYSVAKFIDKKARDAGPAFDIICRFKSERNREVHSLPTFIAAKKAIEYYCENSDDVPIKEKEYVQSCFLIFAEKVCYLEQETNCYGNASTELDS
jgi:thiol-disulfide isomerase/thioredoxin